MDGAPVCEQVLQDVSACLDGELGEERAAEIARHLAGCASCRSRYEREKALKARLSRRARPPAPPEVAQRIRERLLEEDERGDGGPDALPVKPPPAP